MIRYLKNNEINKEKWDTCISTSPQSLVYAESWFLDIVSPDWEALVEDDYSSVFPLTKRKKIGINYLFQPYFTQQLGLFNAAGDISEVTLRAFLLTIPKKFRLIEIQLNSSNIINHVDTFFIRNKLTHVLNLSDSFEKINENYSENLRRNIKKAKHSEINISKKNLFKDVIELFRQNRGLKINNISNSHYKTLLTLLEKAESKNKLDCRRMINTNGKLIAGVIFLKSKHSYILLFSATDNEAKETGAMSLLIDSFIQDHSKEDVFLDFEGSMDANLARFYKSFGSKEIVYLQILKNDLPIIIRWLK